MIAPWRFRAAVVLLAVAAACAVRLTGITHGSPKWIFHPDVSKQAYFAGRVHAGEDNPRLLADPMDEEGFQLTLSPYGTAG